MKFSIVLFVFLFFVIGATGCGKQNDLYIYCSKREIESDFPKMVDAFIAEYKESTGTELTIKVFAGNDDDDATLKTDMGKANVANQPTIYYIDSAKLPDYAAGNQVLDLNSQAAIDLMPEFYERLVKTIDVGDPLTNDGANSFGIPINREGFGYYMNRRTLGELLNAGSRGLDALVRDIQLSTYEEFTAFCLEAEKWIDDPAAANPVLLNGFEYSFNPEKGEQAAKLNGIFSMAGTKEGWTWGFHLYSKSLNLEFPTVFTTSKAKTLEWMGAESYYNTLEFQFDHMTDPTPEETNVTAGAYGSELATEAYSYNASLALFAQGQALMIKQGNWAYTGIAESADQAFLDELFFVPVKYDLTTEAVQNLSDEHWAGLTQIKGDTKEAKMDNFNKSITVFVPNYFVINANAKDEQKKLAMEFLLWMQTSQTGLSYIVDTYQFVPYYPIPSDLNIPIENSISRTIVEYAGAGLTLSNCMSGVPGNVHNEMQEWISEDYLAPGSGGEAGFKGFEDFQNNIVARYSAEWARRAELRDSVN